MNIVRNHDDSHRFYEVMKILFNFFTFTKLNSVRKQLKIVWLDISLNAKYQTIIMTLRKDGYFHRYLRMRSVSDYFNKTNLFIFIFEFVERVREFGFYLKL